MLKGATKLPCIATSIFMTSNYLNELLNLEIISETVPWRSPINHLCICFSSYFGFSDFILKNTSLLLKQNWTEIRRFLAYFAVTFFTWFFNFSDPFRSWNAKPYKFLGFKRVRNKLMTHLHLERYVIFGRPLRAPP